MKRLLNSLLALVLVSLVLPNLGRSEDWPQWRGVNRDGRSPETGLLKEWPKDGPKLVWKATGIGSSFATVSVVGDRIFTMGDLDDASHVIALDRNDGKVLWKAKVGKAGAPGWGGFAGPRVNPTVDGDVLFAVGQYGEAVCLNLADGKEVWRKEYEKDFGGKLPEWGYCGMPLVDGEKVILAPGGSQGNLVALNKKTGELLWQTEKLTDDLHYSSPIIAEIGGVRQYIQLTAASVAGIAAENGSVLWRAPRKGNTAVIPTPIYHDGHVYVTSGYGVGCNLFKITAEEGKFTAKQVYANKVQANQHGGVVLVGDHAYGYSDGKGWTCQDLLTGKAVWQSKKLNKGSLVYADGMFILREEADKGTVALIEATPDGYKEKGRFSPPDRSEKNSWAHPVVSGGKLYLRDQDILLCYDVQGK